MTQCSFCLIMVPLVTVPFTMLICCHKLWYLKHINLIMCLLKACVWKYTPKYRCLPSRNQIPGNILEEAEGFQEPEVWDNWGIAASSGHDRTTAHLVTWLSSGCLRRSMQDKTSHYPIDGEVLLRPHPQLGNYWWLLGEGESVSFKAPGHTPVNGLKLHTSVWVAQSDSVRFKTATRRHELVEGVGRCWGEGLIHEKLGKE